jgi:pyruvate,water dikinase
LNQGLVDGAVEPDRWILDRRKQTIISHTPAKRKYWMVPDEMGVKLKTLPAARSVQPPLGPKEVLEVFQLVRQAEDFFKGPQDLEWTYREKTLFVLQSRPITTVSSPESGDQRSWYLSLHRSFENL